jgi:hypothetical protein
VAWAPFEQRDEELGADDYGQRLAASAAGVWRAADGGVRGAGEAGRVAFVAQYGRCGAKRVVKAKAKRDAKPKAKRAKKA